MRHLALLAGLVPALAATAVEPVRIELVGCSGACREPLRLGDVAHIETADLAAIRTLVGVPLGAGLRSGSASWGRSELAGHLARATGIDPRRIAWSGRESLAAPAMAQGLAAHDVERAAGLALRDWLEARGLRGRVAAAPLQDPRLPPGTSSADLRPRITATHPAGRMVVWVDAWHDGAFIRTLAVSFDVEVYGGPAGRATLAAPAARIGAPTTSPAAAAPPVEPTLVARGEWVDLRYAVGGLRLATRAEALEAGRAGERVRVRLTGATQPVAARVVAPGEVEAFP